MELSDLRKNTMMAHLIDALERGQDIGHYGRLFFAIVAQHFINDDDIVRWLTRDPGSTEAQSRALVQQVKARGYSPPRRERILQWQSQQQFPICPNAGDPDSCNIYKDLKFPDDVYQHIEEYHEQKAVATGG